MRSGQNNRQRNRGNRNRHRGNNGGGGGGNPANKVYDSNGPDVKLRGTAQTVAEKYMQLGRDAQSSGDNVAAESYYQHAEHYYRIWAANQPQGASLIMSRKLGEEEYEEEGAAPEEGAEDEATEGQAPEAAAEGAEAAEQAGDQAQPQGEGQQRQFRNNRDNRDNRDGNRERFRPRWQRNRERFQQEGNPESPANVAGAEPHAPVAEAPEAGGQWEAPSFLQRPTPAPAPAAAPEVAEGDVQPEAPRRLRQRRPRDVAAPVAADEGQQGE
ncbi:MAG: DUF4167 domain-containing protein [Alphaproteobacteria bacterium]|nr:DUF4167 domain-containing protein [Alphaproteobacteria bacterium]